MTHNDHRDASHILLAAAGERAFGKSCGHSKHVGTCPECQQAQLARWRAQLSEADLTRTPVRSAA